MPEVHPIHNPAHSIFGSNLALLASVAAVELDNLALGTAHTLDAVPKLAHVLQEALPKSEPVGLAHALLDPVKADLFGQALNASGKDLKSIREISSGTEEMVQKLLTLNTTASGDELKSLRNFCVALSRSAQADLMTRYDDRPSSPFRR